MDGTRYTIPPGTRCRLAKDDNRTDYVPHVTTKEQVGTLRVRFGNKLILNVGDWCVIVDAESVRKQR